MSYECHMLSVKWKNDIHIYIIMYIYHNHKALICHHCGSQYLLIMG